MSVSTPARDSGGFAAVLGLEGGPALRPGPKRPDSPDSAVVHRRRLVAAVLHVAAEKGYHATTVADVVRRARVSKATFYEHFPSKEECFLAAYREVVAATSAEVVAAVSVPGLTPLQRLLGGLETFLGAMFVAPRVSRVMYLGRQTGTPETDDLRRTGMGHWAGLLCEVVAEIRASSPELATRTRPLDAVSAVALVAGINETLIRAIDAGQDTVTEALRDAIVLQITSAISADAVLLADDVRGSRVVTL